MSVRFRVTEDEKPKRKRKEKKGKKVKESSLLRAERGGGIIRFLVGEKNQVHISRLCLNFFILWWPASGN